MPPQTIWFQNTPAWIGLSLHTRFHALFNDMPHMQFKNFYGKNYSSHPWLWPAYVKIRFASARTVEIKGLCLQLKRYGTEHAAQKIDFLTSTVANGPPLPLWKVSLDSEELLMSCYLFIFFIPSTCPAHDVTNFIDFDWFRQLFRALFDLKTFKPFWSEKLQPYLTWGEGAMMASLKCFWPLRRRKLKLGDF